MVPFYIICFSLFQSYFALYIFFLNKRPRYWLFHFYRHKLRCLLPATTHKHMVTGQFVLQVCKVSGLAWMQLGTCLLGTACQVCQPHSAHNHPRTEAVKLRGGRALSPALLQPTAGKDQRCPKHQSPHLPNWPVWLRSMGVGTPFLSTLESSDVDRPLGPFLSTANDTGSLGLRTVIPSTAQGAAVSCGQGLGT